MTHQISHIGVILDGNRRFAKENGISNEEAYEIAARKVTGLVQWILIEKMAKTLSIYALSLDNVRKRLPAELEPIYTVQQKTYDYWRDSRLMLDNNICVKFVGEINILPKDYRKACLHLEMQTSRCNGKKFYILVAYSGKLEAIKTANHFRLIEPIDYNNIQDKFLNYLPVKEYVDLVIRTAGEQRLSDFLPYQSSYAEFIFIDKFFPAITKEDILEAIDNFEKRKRKFGE